MFNHKHLDVKTLRFFCRKMRQVQAVILMDEWTKLLATKYASLCSIGEKAPAFPGSLW